MGTELLIYPALQKNPQRGDAPTPLLKKPDNSQCMGNSFQSCLNWIGEVDPAMNGMSAERFNTYNYYAVLEPWLLAHRLIRQSGGTYFDPNDQIYTMSNHANCFNEVLFLNDSKFKFTYYGTADLNSLIGHITKYQRPVILGTKLSPSGHIIRIVGYITDGTGKVTHLKVDDPYGSYPYKTSEEKSGGFYVDYPCDVASNTLCDKPITRMVTIDEV